MNTFKQNYLSPATTNCLKGIMALIIVAGHIRDNLIWLNDTFLGQLLTISGYLCVAVFFFFSGYGLMFQYRQRGQTYVDGFPKRRLLDIYAKYLLLIALYATAHILYGSIPTVPILVHSLLFGGTLVYAGWYLQAVLVLYLFFWLVVKFVPNKPMWHGAGFVLSLFAYCGLCWALGCSLMWYQSILGFFLGLIVAYNKETIDAHLAKRHTDVWMLLLSLIICGAFLVGSKLAVLGTLITVLSKTMAAPFFVMFAILSLRFIKIQNRVTTWLGKLSFEIYVIHGLFLNLLRKEPLYINDGVYIVAVFACSMLTAIPLNKLFTLISNGLKKIP